MNEMRNKAFGRVTIRTVAEDAGVSVAAVSKVLRNAYGVSEALRENVQASIGRLGYRPSTAAQSMRGRTSTVGILLVEMANPFLPGLVGSINKVLAGAHYKSLMGVGEAQLKIESSLIESMIDFRMDGVILIAPRSTGKSLDSFASQIPMVVVGHHEASSSTFDTINSDDVNGAKMATQALIHAGHQKIHMISPRLHPHSEIDVFRQRETGYAEAMQEAGLGGHIRVLRASEKSPVKEKELGEIAAGKQATAYFCWSDLHAVVLCGAARAAGLRVPEDIAIVGYDNSPIAAMPPLNLSSIDQNSQQLGAMAAKALISRIAGRTLSEHILLEPKLVRRASL
ncbi:MAG: LacI family DNA-binding transcriptional regulator [Rhizobiaceae bacterium]